MPARSPRRRSTSATASTFASISTAPEDRLFISKPVVGRVSRQWSVQFTRRFLNSDGKFGGVVVTSLNPAHLTDFYNRIDFGILDVHRADRPGRRGAIERRRQRRLRARAGPQQDHDVPAARSRPPTRPSRTSIPRPARPGSSHFRKVRGHPLCRRRQPRPQRNLPRLPRRLPAQLPGRPDPHADHARRHGAHPRVPRRRRARRPSSSS